MFFKDTLLCRPAAGVSGSVEIWKTSKGVKYAVKTYHEREPHELRKEYHSRVLYEYNLLKKLDHEAFYAPQKYSISWNGLAVSMYMEAGLTDMAKLLRQQKPTNFSVAENLCYFKQIVAGIAYLHGQGLCHRDIKLENMVLLDTGKLKIIDMATVTESDSAIGIVGSPKYMAPEMVSQIRYDGKKVDIWSLGVILVYFANKRFLWKTAHLSDAKYKSWASGETPLGAPERLRAFVSRLLHVEPELRISVEALQEETIFEKIPWCHGKKSCGQQHTLIAELAF